MAEGPDAETGEDEFARWLRRKRDEAVSLGRRTRYAVIDDLIHDYLRDCKSRTSERPGEPTDRTG